MKLRFVAHEVDVRAKCVDRQLDRLSVSQTRGVVPSTSIEHRALEAKTYDNYKVVSEGDLVVNRFNAYKGALGLSKTDGLVSPDYMVIRCNSRAFPKYIEYLLKSDQVSNEIRRDMGGIGGASPDASAFSRLNSLAFFETEIPIPNTDLQRVIADYLDRETNEIDAMLDKLDGLGRLLEERRQSEVRDSVAPEGASFTQVKYLAQVSLGKTVQSKKLSENDRLTNYVRAANIQPNGLALDDQKMYMTPDELVKYDIAANDVLVVEGGAGYGRSVTVEADMLGWGFQNHVIRLRPNHGVVGKFLEYTIKNHLWGGLLDILSDGATIPAISSDKARELPVLAASYREQERIVAHLDETTARIDAMLSKTQQLKDLLTERRSVLITAAVTGQIEVH